MEIYSHLNNKDPKADKAAKEEKVDKVMTMMITYLTENQINDDVKSNEFIKKSFL